MKKAISILMAIVLVMVSTVFVIAGNNQKGDANKDGKINSADALLILQYVVGQKSSIDKDLADVNSDGKINSNDALQVLQIVVGVIKTTNTTTTTKKTTTTTTTTTTKKPTTTTTKATTLAPFTGEINVNNVPKMIGTNKRAWRIIQNGLNITVTRLEYGAKKTQMFNNQNLYNSSSGQIVNPKNVTFQPAASVAVIETSNPAQLHISKGSEDKASGTENLAKAENAIIAVNGHTGSYYQTSAAVVRDGVFYRSYTGTSTAKSQRLLMYKDGTWKISSLGNEKAKSEISNGLYNSVRYQKIVVDGGQVNVSPNNSEYLRHHTYIGQINKNKYVFMVVEFMPIYDAATILKAYGCKTAVQIQGGNCSQMYVKGIGNTTYSSGASIKNLNKIGVFETEWFAKWGLLAQGKGGGPCFSEYDVIYFK